MKRITHLLLVQALVFACKSPDPKEKVLRLRDMAELATVEYHFTKVIKAADDQTWYKMGSRKILFTCEAKAKAGVDLSQLKETDIAIDQEGRITLKLPKGKMILIDIDPNKIKEEYREVSFSRNDFSVEEKEQLLKKAQSNIDSLVAQSGIIEAAEKNARDVIDSWLNQNGLSNHEIVLQ
jgi:hypothetical protein